MVNSIFGYSFKQILAKQQGIDFEKLPPINAEKHKALIIKDIEKFRISVHDEVVKSYHIELPTGYKLNSETKTWEFIKN